MLLTNGLLFAQNQNDLKLDRIYKEIKTIKYSEADFIKMQQHFINNSELNNFITQKIKQGDKNAANFFEILNLSYSDANKKYGNKEIKVMIFSYYKSIEMEERFKKLNSEFDAKIDSLKTHKEIFEKEIESQKDLFDSIKQPYIEH